MWMTTVTQLCDPLHPNTALAASSAHKGVFIVMPLAATATCVTPAGSVLHYIDAIVLWKEHGLEALAYEPSSPELLGETVHQS